MFLLRTLASSSFLTLIPCVACLTPTTILVTKLSTSTLMPSSCVATTSGTAAHTRYNSHASRCQQPNLPVRLVCELIDSCVQRTRVHVLNRPRTTRAAIECRPTERIEPGQEREYDVVVNIDCKVSSSDPVHESPHDVHLRLPDIR